MSTAVWKSEPIKLADGVTVDVRASADGVSQAYSTAAGVLVSESLKTPDEAYTVACALIQAAAECRVMRAKS